MLLCTYDRGRWGLASCQVSSKSIQWLQRRSRKMFQPVRYHGIVASHGIWVRLLLPPYRGCMITADLDNMNKFWRHSTNQITLWQFHQERQRFKIEEFIRHGAVLSDLKFLMSVKTLHFFSMEVAITYNPSTEGSKLCEARKLTLRSNLATCCSCSYGMEGVGDGLKYCSLRRWYHGSNLGLLV